jgi:HD-like signal output (HDOD) protein
MAERLGLDAWAAHSAGLFEECGKAALFRHAPEHYRAMLRAAPSDVDLIALERAGFGVSHEVLGAALCDSWGLAPAAVASVRHHVQAQAEGVLPAELARRPICALSAVVQRVIEAPQDLEEACACLGPQADLDATLLLRAATKVAEQLELAREVAHAG